MYLMSVTAYFATTFLKYGFLATTTETFPTKEQCEAAKSQVVYQIRQSTKGDIDKLNASCTYIEDEK